MKLLKGIFDIILFVILTALTQVGGVVLFITEIIFSGFTPGLKRNVLRVLGFILLYGLVSWLALPPLAENWGKERLLPTSTLKPQSYLSILFNRNYVKRELKSEIENIANNMDRQYFGTITYFYDANFPLFSYFPLFPHLSHSDGKKIDLGFYYSDANGASVSPPSLFGYGYFEEAQEGEINQVESCFDKGYYQYSFTSALGLFANSDGKFFNEQKTAFLLNLLQQRAIISKVFVEPHIAQRLGISHDKIRYQGCHAVRHDDHVHIEIK